MNPNEPTASAAATTSNPDISEQNFPIQINWVWKQVSLAIVSASVTIFSLTLLFYSENADPSGVHTHIPLIVLPLVSVIAAALRLFVALMQRKYYHFEFGDQYITVRQGIINRQERHIPYGVIQDLTVMRSLTDRIFGIASINASNATQQANVKGMSFWQSWKASSSRNRSDNSADAVMGSNGQNFSLPGQSPEAAEQLRQIILAKMKESPDWGIQAGL